MRRDNISLLGIYLFYQKYWKFYQILLKIIPNFLPNPSSSDHFCGQESLSFIIIDIAILWVLHCFKWQALMVQRHKFFKSFQFSSSTEKREEVKRSAIKVFNLGRKVSFSNIKQNQSKNEATSNKKIELQIWPSKYFQI